MRCCKCKLKNVYYQKAISLNLSNDNEGLWVKEAGNAENNNEKAHSKEGKYLTFSLAGKEYGIGKNGIKIQQGK